MQSYERIGLVALMFLVVLLVVGALWDDGSPEDVVLAAGPRVERIDEAELARQADERAQAERLAAAEERLRRRSSAESMPISGQDEVSAEVKRVTTMSAGADHRSAPLEEERRAVRAPSVEELQGLNRPGRAQEPAGQVSTTQRSSRRRVRPDDQVARTDGSSRERSGSSAPTTTIPVSTAPGTTASSANVASTQPPANLPSARTYVVKSGDALQKIAARELGDRSLADSIAALNGLSNPDMIRIGMVLTLPTTSANPNAARAARAAEASKEANDRAGASILRPLVADVSAAAVGGTLTVRKGEALSRALTRELGTYKRSIALVKALNPGLNPDRIFAGQVIKLPRLEDIPAGASSSKPSSTRRATESSAPPALSTSTRGSAVAAADPAPSRSRSDSEFIVR